MIDFHTHILPRIDDGSSSSQESLGLLDAQKEQGVDKIVFTPHFYAEKDSITDFLYRREKAYQNLMSKLDSNQTKQMKLYIGAEVYYFPGIGKAERISELCIQGTNILLLEMPFAQWDENVVAELRYLIQKRKLTLMIAHIERYYSFQRDKQYWQEVFALPVYTQINAGSFLRWKDRKRVLRFLRSGAYQVVLGSDCHNMSRRFPNLQDGRAVIAAKLGEEYLHEIDALGERILP